MKKEKKTNPAIFTSGNEGLIARAIERGFIKTCEFCEGSGVEFNEENRCRVCTTCDGNGYVPN